ncbi:MAG: protein translocase subunit SecD [Alphaproteobacteria bacterium]|nr:protein translocase subunit SecD [Alphaproteobacteria bacterium]
MLHIPAWRVIVTLLIVAAGILFAVPTFLSEKTVAQLPTALRQQINLGLDLQGGSHLLLEVDVAAVVRERLEGLVEEVRTTMRNERINYVGLGHDADSVRLQLRETADIERARTALRGISRQISLGNILGATAREIDVTIDEAGRTRLLLTKEAIEDRARAAIEQSLEIVRRRVDETGTKEPNIVRQGTDRILVQLPGEQNPERIKRLLGQTAKLAFRLVDLTAQPGGPVPAGSEVLPVDPKALERGGPREYVVRRQVMVSGENLVQASEAFDQQTGQPVVNFRFDSAGGRRFGQVTSENVGRPFAIILDGKVISAPVIRQAIIGGSGQISGGFTVQEAKDLALLLRAGALPAPLNVIEERTVGPDLGSDSIRAGTIACLIGYLLIVTLMVVGYGLFGLIANLALLLNLAFTVTIMAVIGATLTLPGIAGMVLGLAMAVDANVLIYERMREEMDQGRTPFPAVDAAFQRAFGTIVDSNLTTLIAALLLYMFGSGPVRGFSVTLSIGIICSMFTAVTVTRMLVVGWLRWRRPKALPL